MIAAVNFAATNSCEVSSSSCTPFIDSPLKDGARLPPIWRPMWDVL
jgi:hypothetical protein